MVRALLSRSMVLVVLASWGCGTSELSTTREDTQALCSQAATPVWLSSLPATLSEVNETAALEVHKCRISIGTALEIPPFPPVHHAWLRKEGCAPGGYALLGTSYSLPSLLLAGDQKVLAATFTFRETPSGSAYQKAQVVAVDFTSGVITHASTLGALPPSGTGLVEPDRLDLRGNGTVVVGGLKNGVMPGEVGSGDHFLALFEKFADDPLFNPPPSLVLAF